MNIVASVFRLWPKEREESQGWRWGRNLRVAAEWFVVSYLGSMLAWVLIPAAVMGWTPMVIVSGSMAPAILPGDVVLVDSNSPGREPGAVLAFEFGTEGDPVIHRVVAEPRPGIYMMKGDRNLAVDSTPLPEEAVLGQGRLLIPLIGYPKVWVHERDAAAVLASPALLLLFLKRRRRGLLLFAGGLLLGWLTLSAAAAFTDVTPNAQSSLGTQTVLPPASLNATCPAGLGLGSQVRVDLTWPASPTAAVTGYQVFYDAPPVGGGSVLIGSVAAPQTSFSHTIPNAQLAQGQPHTYVVRAVINPWVSLESVARTVTVTTVLLAYVCS